VSTEGIRVTDWRATAVVAASTTVLALAWLVPPIAQDPAYHQFADTRQLLGIPNFWNVVTNLGFILVGLKGLRRLYQRRPPGVLPELRTVYFVLFAALVLLGCGSAWYHLQPDNASLVYDRLPIAIASMALLCVFLGEHVAPALGRDLLAPLLLVGAGSVIYWHLSERNDHGDLRFYLLVQFVPITLAVLLLWRRPSHLDRVGVMWIPVIGYGLAKCCESADAWIYSIGHVLGGHALKHLIAALGLGALLWAIENRRILRHRNLTAVP